MEFVYHAVPTSMVGTVLFPLADLARVSPAAFDLQRSKYASREAVLDAVIRADGLRFNATVHCAPLHPNRLHRLRASLDLLPQRRADSVQPPPWTPGLFFEIPIDRIHHPAYWYRWQTRWINGYPGEDVPLSPPLDEFEVFDVNRYHELSEVPVAHLEYLRRQKAEGKPMLMFVHIPHVLVAGPIETRGLRTISWEDAISSGDIPLSRLQERSNAP